MKQTQKNTVNFKAIFKRLFRFMAPYRKGLILSVILIIFSSLFNSFGPFILGKATDSLLGLVIDGVRIPEGIRRFITILAVLAVVYILYAVLKFL